MSADDFVDTLVARAEAFACEHHAGQVRKYTGEPYEEHLRSVVARLKKVTDNPHAIAAAWLHDVVEDTDVTSEQVCEEFGLVVGAMVDCLTDCGLDRGNREMRKAIDRARLALACAEVQTVKLADMIDNTESIAKHDKNFARTYLPEISLLLDRLTQGDPRLREEAERVLAQAMASLESAS